MLKKLKEDLDTKFPGFRTLCPPRWTVCGGSLQCVIIENWNVLQQLWDKCLETKLKPDIKGRFGEKQQMGIFDYFYGVNLGGMLLRHTDNLSCAIQTSDMSVAECQLVVALTTKTLTKVSTEETFSLFWERCKKAATKLKINEPVLPHKGNVL